MSGLQDEQDNSALDQFAIENFEEQDNTETTGRGQDGKEDYKSLQAELKVLKEQNSQLLSQFANQPAYQPPPQAAPKSQEVDESALEQLAKNPKALLNYVNQKIDSGISTVQNESLKKHFDDKVYEEFPSLKTNKDFNDLVKTQIRELVSNGEYGAQHPMLVYRAAQLAAAKMGGSKDNKTQSRDTSLSPSNQRGTTRSSGIKDNDPRLAFAVAAGVTDPKKLAKFKKDLEAHYGSTEEHMKKRGQLKPRGRTIGGR